MNLLPAEQEDQVGQLKKTCPTAPTQTLLSKVHDQFQRDETLQTLVITDADRPVGLMNRNMLNELFSRPFTRELYGSSKVAEFMIPDPVIVETETSVDDLTRIILNEKMSAMQDGFILTHNEQYAGVGFGHDLLQLLSERKQQHLFKLAHYDHLTGLPNRLMFVDRLTQACLRAERSQEMIGLLFVDLDRFKEVNDTLGHAAGDELLIRVSERLRFTVRKVDSVSRLGGDEFTVTLEGIPAEATASEVANKIIASLQAPFAILGVDVTVTASIGISYFPAQAVDAEELQRNADVAMYQAKADGKNRHRAFAEHMLVSDRASLSMESELRNALSRRELEVYYQPQVDLVDQRIIGVESLLRWNRPGHGVVGPGEFLALADELGLMDDIGAFVLRETCRQIVEWKKRLQVELTGAVNLSFSQLENRKLPGFVAQVLKESGLEASGLMLEVTEQTIMNSVERSHANIERLGRLGVQLAIDDFGTGYSSLSYLLNLPIDRLKIDRCFIQGIERGGKARALTRAILNLANSLELRAVAEGVETLSQLDFLKQNGCRFAQGFLFSRPLPAAVLEPLLLDAASGATSLVQPEVDVRPKPG
ncbi:EAL domain-containing protein [Wenzhouxiangella limi]|uniref:EAL domain-containing protein n=1 Tax=Wenzhouxiangella limi TaxID=2707351 RepID=A0A845UWJ3_9GAMM|nr:EAL domain-containing protein [Wenzhouxiangella limi]NDY95807.1 EAL domain-containing protein [Wenzhouxiangella limi]